MVARRDWRHNEGMRRPLFLLPVLAALVLVACPIPPPPGITGVTVIIDDRSNDELTPGTSVVISYLIDVDSPYAARQVSGVSVTDADGNDKNYNATKTAQIWDAGSNRFEAVVIETAALPDSAALGTTTISLTSEGHPAETYTVDVFALGDPANTTRFVYSDADGSPPQILPPPTGYGAVITAGTLTVTFDTVDTRVQDAYAWLLDADGDLLHFALLNDVLALNDNNTNTYNTDVSGISGITQAQLMLFSAHENGDDRIIYRSVSAPVGVDP